MLSTFNPALSFVNLTQNFKEGHWKAGFGSFGKTLILLQIVSYIMIAILALTTFKQVDFMSKRHPGFAYDELMVVKYLDIDFAPKYKEVKKELLSNPSIKSVSGSSSEWGSESHIALAFKIDGVERSINLLTVDTRFEGVFGPAITAGIPFREYATTNKAPMIINDRARELFLSEPLGTGIDQGAGSEIIGTVDNFNYQPFHHDIDPVVIVYDSSALSFSYLYIRFAKDKRALAEKWIEQTWEKLIPDEPLHMSYVKEDFMDRYQEEETHSQFLAYLSLIVLGLALVGLITLITVITKRRMKEFTIRRSFGANRSAIMILILRELSTLFIISTLIAFPFAYFLSVKWLETFAYHIDVNFFSFGLTLGSIVLITLAVTYHRSSKSIQVSTNEVLSSNY